MMTMFNRIPLFLFLVLTINCVAQQEGKVMSSDGNLIYFRTFGSGKPLLLINGGPGMNSNGFEGLATKLSKNYMTILYDQRGTGKSELPKLDSSTITMQLMIDDMESLRKYFGFETWSILGHSFGGMVASYYATQFPEHIDKMILSSSGGIDLELLHYAGDAIKSKLTQEESDSLAYWTQKIDNGDRSHSAALGRGRAMAPAYLYDKKYVPVIAERLTQGNQDINQLIWSDMMKINFDCTGKLKDFKRPVLIIQGEYDILKPEIAEKAHLILSNSKLVFMDHCGHYGWLDNEEVYFREVNALMNSNN